MKKFICKISIFLGPFIVFLTMSVLFLPENSYDLAIIDKHRALANIDGQKLVLVGGSNIAFGIDSEAIQNKFHLPVFNMGVDASFGLGRMLDDVLPFLHSGDYLLVIPEYTHFTSTWNGESNAYLLIFDARRFRLLFSSCYELPKGFPEYSAKHLILFFARIAGINLENPLAYTRDGFNKYGDYVKHLGLENRAFDVRPFVGILNKTYLNNFFKLVDILDSNGITVILTYPNYDEQSFHNSSNFINELDISLRTKEKLQVISMPKDYCFPTSLFFDTAYHLNLEGRALRTDLLIRDLQNAGIIFLRQ